MSCRHPLAHDPPGQLRRLRCAAGRTLPALAVRYTYDVAARREIRKAGRITGFGLADCPTLRVMVLLSVVGAEA